MLLPPCDEPISIQYAVAEPFPPHENVTVVLVRGVLLTGL
jgi:hypothetical protein